MDRLLAEGSPLRTYSAQFFRRTRWLLLLVITILGGTSTLLAIPETGARIRNQIPLVRCWWPVPMDSARFSMVFAPIVSVSESGRSRVDADGRALSHLLYTQVEEGFAAQSLGVPVELRSPSVACPVRGRNADERAQAAAALAKSLGASVIVYGALTAADNLARFYPEFYVSASSAQERSEVAQIAGPYKMGAPIPLRLPVQAQEYVGLDDHPALVRVRAMGLVALGLRAAGAGQPQRALEFFRKAEEMPGWLESEGKETVYLLMGNAASTLAYEEKDVALLEEALGYFDHALAIDPTFARAVVGRANVLYQQSLGDFAALQCANLDKERLKEAQGEYARAASLPAPVEAEIALKVHYGLGNAALVQTYCEDEGALAEARAEYGAVVGQHEAGPVINRELAGHAYARLALVAADKDLDPAAALRLYEKAVPLVSERWQAEYLLLAGDLARDEGRNDEAGAFYRRAQDAATLTGTARLIDEAARRLSALPSQ